MLQIISSSEKKVQRQWFKVLPMKWRVCTLWLILTCNITTTKILWFHFYLFSLQTRHIFYHRKHCEQVNNLKSKSLAKHDRQLQCFNYNCLNCVKTVTFLRRKGDSDDDITLTRIIIFWFIINKWDICLSHALLLPPYREKKTCFILKKNVKKFLWNFQLSQNHASKLTSHVTLIIGNIRIYGWKNTLPLI